MLAIGGGRRYDRWYRDTMAGSWPMTVEFVFPPQQLSSLYSLYRLWQFSGARGAGRPKGGYIVCVYEFKEGFTMEVGVL